MNYDNSQVRRQDRLLDEQRAWELLRESEYGVLSMISEEGTPYGIPVNYVWDGQDAIYIHCAPKGRKLRALEVHPKVSLSVVGRVNLLPSRFTTEYESIVVEGKAHLHLPKDERRQALRLLLEKLSPDDLTVGLKYAEKSFHRTEVIRIDIIKMSGKSKRVLA